MILLPADGYREHLLELRPVDHSEFQGVAIPPVSLVFGEYGVRVRLVDQKQGACPVLLQGEPVETVQIIGRMVSMVL